MEEKKRGGGCWGTIEMPIIKKSGLKPFYIVLDLEELQKLVISA